MGSNLGDPLAHLRQAFTHLHNLTATRVIGCSPLYQNPAIGPGEQPDYLNAVVALRTELVAIDLLAGLQAIELQQGRHRGERWAARTLDLDILLYGDEVFDSPLLQIPHPRMLQRNFVLYPLYDIAPDLSLPDGSTLRGHLDSCPSDGLTQTPLTLQE
jgi:2-amino-4-hydroxy-6-hydroxymethyldihydropteridine diphosphokinase